MAVVERRAQEADSAAAMLWFGRRTEKCAAVACLARSASCECQVREPVRLPTRYAFSERFSHLPSMSQNNDSKSFDSPQGTSIIVVMTMSDDTDKSN